MIRTYFSSLTTLLNCYFFLSPSSYQSFVKLETRGKFQMECIEKCSDTMVIGTLGTPHNTTAEIDKWVCTQWILYKRIKINLQKVGGELSLLEFYNCSKT